MNKEATKNYILLALQRGDLEPDPKDRDMTEDELDYDFFRKSYFLICEGGLMYDFIVSFIENSIEKLEILQNSMLLASFYNPSDLDKIVSDIQTLKSFLELNGF